MDLGVAEQLVTPMKKSSELVFIMLLNSLPSGGTITRAACGRTMRRIASPWVIPSDCAASIWPRSIASMPARMISRMYAPSLMPSARMPAIAAPLSVNSAEVRRVGISVKPNRRFAPK